MKLTNFPEQTIVLSKPQGMTDEECGSLAILQQENGCCISCWKMDWSERIKALLTGVVWVGVLSGRTQPPIFAAVHKPFYSARPSLWKRLLIKCADWFTLK